jgi:putative Holliday junction resolvase
VSDATGWYMAAMRILGVDPGSRRIGLALSDEGGTLASPLATVERAGFEAAVAAVARIAQENEVRTIVIGLPLRLDGREGPEAQRARVFGEALRAAAGDGVDICYLDERFTTAQAERALRAAGRRGRKQRAVVDQVAATVLLQGYLDARLAERQ